MEQRISRRDMLKTVGVAGAGALLPPGIASPQQAPARVLERDVEVIVSGVSEHTVRIVLLAPPGGDALSTLNRDGALVRQAWPELARIRSLDAARRVRAGNLRVEVTPDLTVRVQHGDRLAQQLRVNQGTLSFLLGDGGRHIGAVRGRWEIVRVQTRDVHTSRDGVAKCEPHASTVHRAWFADAAARSPPYQRTRRRRQPHAIGQVRGISADGAPLIGSHRTLIGQSGFRI